MIKREGAKKRRKLDQKKCGSAQKDSLPTTLHFAANDKQDSFHLL